ncbi:radical SAM protein [Candidatus Omnitrophota bacterium]
MQKRSVYIFTNGCPENRMDCAYVENKMREHGWMITLGAQQADLILFNACGLTNEAEAYSLNIIKKLKKIKKKDAKVVVWGCLPKINREHFDEDDLLIAGVNDVWHESNQVLHQTEECKNVDVNYYSDRVNDISDLYCNDVCQNVYEKIKLGVNFLSSGTLAAKILKKAHEHKKGNRETCVYTNGTFPIKIASGCLSNCSFCAVKLSRGALRSKPMDKVIEEFERGLKQGYKKIFLVGTDVGSYGRDMGCALIDLLRKMIQYDSDYEIMLRNFHPIYIIEMWPELLDILKSGKITTICSPVQSGSDQVLKRMRRGHSVSQYSDTIFALKEQCPFLKIRTQMMVGFPGETDDDFCQTESLLKELPFDFVEIYKFQPRLGTDAYDYEQLPQHVINKRFTRLLFMSFLNN